MVPRWATLLRSHLPLQLMDYRTDHSHGCCAVTPPGPGSEACLIPLRSDETPRCVEAPDFLVPADAVTARCEWSCANGQTCARLRGGEQFLRIGVQSGDQDGSMRVVLWRGQREEIYQDGMIPALLRCLMVIWAYCGRSGRYQMAATVVDSSSLAPRRCNEDDNVRR